MAPVRNSEQVATTTVMPNNQNNDAVSVNMGCAPARNSNNTPLDCYVHNSSRFPILTIITDTPL